MRYSDLEHCQYRLDAHTKQEFESRATGLKYSIARFRKLNVGPAAAAIIRWWLEQPKETQVKILERGTTLEAEALRGQPAASPELRPSGERSVASDPSFRGLDHGTGRKPEAKGKHKTPKR